MKSHRTCALLLACGLLAVAAAQAADMYRWTDAQGRVHITDRPPPADARNVTKIDSRQFEASPKDQQEARDRAAKDRERLQQIEAGRESTATAAAPAASAASGAGGGAAAKSPPPPNESECGRLKREYQASASCWGQFSLSSGGSRAGALEKCGPPVTDPAGRCP